MPEARRSIRASVVVCVYTEKRLPQIRAALDSIARQTMPPWQVIVVADHNPALCDRLAAEFPDHEVIPNKLAKGLSGARNTGIERTAGEVVVFLDDDARAQPQWLETLLASYDDESVLGVGGLVLADWSSPGRPAWLPEEFLWVVGCSYRGQPEVKAEVRNPIGANMSFRRSAFEQAGLFDSSVGRTSTSTRPLGCEETEFSIRLRRLSPPGARIIYEPQAVVYHHVDQSRVTLRYFLSRCRAEGCSKARVSRLSGASAALSSERSYVSHTIIRAMRRELSGVFRRGRSDSMMRLAAMSLGTLSATVGYLMEMVQQNTRGLAKTAERKAAVPKPRWVHLAWLHFHDWLSVTPIFLPTVRFRPALREPEDPRPWVSRTTEIVIEGYPRSGNTFAVVAFRQAQGREIEIANHLHAAAQIKRAARLDVPAMVLIREPSEAILSLVVRDPQASIRWALRSYIRFYSSVLPYLEKAVVAPFATVTSDFASIIRIVNTRYGTAFKEFVPTEDALQSVRQTVEWMGQLDSKRTGWDYGMTVALPSEQRRRAKEARQTEYLAERNERLRLTAESLYESVMQYSRI